MSSQRSTAARRLERARLVVRRSGVAAELEQKLREGRGGAPRRLSVEVLLAAGICVFDEHKTATLVQVRRVLTKDLPTSAQFRIGVRWRKGTQKTRKITMRQVRYLFGRIVEVYQYSPHFTHGLTAQELAEREDEFIAHMFALVVASRPTDVPMSPTLALDATAVESAARPSGRLGSSSGEADYRGEATTWSRDDAAPNTARTPSWDPDARWDYRTRTHQKGTDSFYGSQDVVATDVHPKDSPFHDLHLIAFAGLVPGGYLKAAPTLRLLDAHIAGSHRVSTVISDMGFSHWAPEPWADQLRAREIVQVMDVHPSDRGGYLDLKTGAYIHNGWPYAPWVDKTLFDVPQPRNLKLRKPAGTLEGARATARDLSLSPRKRSAALRRAKRWMTYKDNLARLEAFNEAQAELSRYALQPLCALRPDGSRRYKQPAYKRETATPAQRRTKVFSQSVTLSLKKEPGDKERPEKLAKLVQPKRHGSSEWIDEFTQRPRIEGVYGVLESKDAQGVQRGWIRLVGIVRTDLMAIFAKMNYNLRTARGWMKKHDFISADPVFTIKPKEPTGSSRNIDETPVGAIDPPVAA